MYLSVAHTSRSGKEASGAYDHLGELDQALFMYLDHGSGHGATHQEQRRKCVLPQFQIISHSKNLGESNHFKI